MLEYQDGRKLPEYGMDQKGMISGLYAQSAYAPGSELKKHAKRRKDLDCAAFRHQAKPKRKLPAMRRKANREMRQAFEQSEARRRWQEACKAMKS